MDFELLLAKQSPYWKLAYFRKLLPGVCVLISRREYLGIICCLPPYRHGLISLIRLINSPRLLLKYQDGQLKITCMKALAGAPLIQHVLKLDHQAQEG